MRLLKHSVFSLATAGVNSKMTVFFRTSLKCLVAKILGIGNGEQGVAIALQSDALTKGLSEAYCYVS